MPPPLPQQLAHERVVRERVRALRNRDKREAERTDRPREPGLEPQRLDQRRRELVERRGVEDRIAHVGTEWPEHLLVEERAERPLGVLPALRAEHHPERPSARRVHRRRHIGGGGIAAEADAEDLLALVRAEREVLLVELREMARDACLGRRDAEAAARRNGDAEPPRPRPDQPLEDAERIQGADQPLGVVDDEHHGVDEDRVQVRRQPAGHRERLSAGCEALEQRARDARQLGLERREERDEEPPGIALVLRDARPRDGPAARGQRLLEQGGLPVAGAGDHQQGAAVERTADARHQRGARDPRGRGHGLGQGPGAYATAR